jgi:hypothetical protein
VAAAAAATRTTRTDGSDRLCRPYSAPSGFGDSETRLRLWRPVLRFACLARSCLSVHQDRTDNQATTDCDPHNPPFSIVLVENNDNNVAVQYSTRRSF